MKLLYGLSCCLSLFWPCLVWHGLWVSLAEGNLRAAEGSSQDQDDGELPRRQG